MNWIRRDRWWMQSNPPGYTITVAVVRPGEVSYVAFSGGRNSLRIVAARGPLGADDAQARAAAVYELQDACEAADAPRRERDALIAKRKMESRKHA